MWKKHDEGNKHHDQIHEDLKNKQKFKNLPKDEDKPGLGQFYCISCARHFANKESLAHHWKSKQHKRRLQNVMEEPHTQKEAEELGKI